MFQKANGAAGHRGLTARALVEKVDRVEVAAADLKSREKLSRMAGVLENRSRKKLVLTGNALVRIHLLSFVAGINFILWLNVVGLHSAVQLFFVLFGATLNSAK